MITQEALKNKANCILAHLRGQQIEVFDISKNQYVLNDDDSFNLDGWYYRVKPTVSDVPFGCVSAKEIEAKCNIKPRRIRPKPKLPDGVFWIAHMRDTLRCHLVTLTHNHICEWYFAYQDKVERNYSCVNALHSDGYLWSHDRKTWYTFDNHTTQAKVHK
jgi:hypothetical protein